MIATVVQELHGHYKDLCDNWFVLIGHSNGRTCTYQGCVVMLYEHGAMVVVYMRTWTINAETFYVMFDSCTTSSMRIIITEVRTKLHFDAPTNERVRVWNLHNTLVQTLIPYSLLQSRFYQCIGRKENKRDPTPCTYCKSQNILLILLWVFHLIRCYRTR